MAGSCRAGPSEASAGVDVVLVHLRWSLCRNIQRLLSKRQRAFILKYQLQLCLAAGHHHAPTPSLWFAGQRN